MVCVVLGFLMSFLQLQAATPGPAGSNGFLVRTYSVEDGLPVNSVQDIIQDQYGYLYFATLYGMVRYDGYEFVTFNSSNTPGINTDRFIGIKMTGPGNLWLFTETGELTLLRNGSFFTFNEQHGITGEVYTIEETPDGTIWAATSNGLSRFEQTSYTFIPIFDDEYRIPVTDLASAEHGVLGLNEQGLFSWENGTFNLLLSHSDFPFHSSGSLNIRALGNHQYFIFGVYGMLIYEIGSGIIFSRPYEQIDEIGIWNVARFNQKIILATLTGLYEIDIESEALKPLPSAPYTYLNRPNLVYTKERKLTRFGPEILINGKPLIKDSEVYVGFVDREGSIWIATNRDGLLQFRNSIITNITSVNGAPLENTYPIIQGQNGDIWAGSFVSGVYRFNKNGITRWDVLNSSLSSHVIRFMFEDSDGSIYAAPWEAGLWKFTGNDWSPLQKYASLNEPENMGVEAMFRDSNGMLIIGTRGATVFDVKGQEITMFDSTGVDFKGVRVIREKENGAILMGSNGNGLGLLRSDGTFTSITSSEGLSSNYIRDIFIQSEDTVWLATENKGLNRLVFGSTDVLQSVKILNSGDRLIDNSLHRIIKDHRENIWVSSNSGIMQISLKELNEYADNDYDFLRVVGYNQRDGMVNNEANGGVMTAGVLTTNNEIWFPNQKGVTIFDLTKSDSVNFSGNIHTVIEHLSLQDSLIRVVDKSSISLPNGERNFTIKFTSPNFAYPERMIYKYRLSGINNKWQYANNSLEAVFTNVNAGVHDFELQTLFPDGNIAASSLAIIVPPFYYETGWFRALIVLLVLGAGFVAYRMRVRSLVLREQELQGRVHQQTIELQKAADEKSRFFAGITHELKTPLSLIIGPLDDYLENPSSSSEKKFRNYAHMMHRNGYRLKNLIDQILEVSKLNADAIRLRLRPTNLEQLTRQVCGQFQSLLDQKGIALEIQTSLADELIYVDKEAWERIVINLISNAIKFSDKGSTILVRMIDNEKSVNVIIQDSGKGIPKEELENIFDYLYQVEGDRSAEGTGIGLFLVKGLIERMRGSISVESKTNEGTTFTLSLLKGYNHFEPSDSLSHDVLESELIVSRKIFQVQHQSTITSRPSEPGECILIVEDNDDFRNYLDSSLSESYKTVLAKNGKEALELIEKVTPDIVISDLMMPVLGGLEFVKKLRKKEHLFHLPVIFLSAKDQETDVQMGLSTGADIYLTKPIRTSTLLSQIEAVLRRERVLKNSYNKPETQKSEPEFLAVVRDFIYRQMGNPGLNVDMLAEALFMSRSKFYRQWRTVSKDSITDYIKKVRFEEARVLLGEKKFSIHDTALAVGFSDPNYFSTSFKNEYGYPPSELLK